MEINIKLTLEETIFTTGSQENNCGISVVKYCLCMQKKWKERESPEIKPKFIKVISI